MLSDEEKELIEKLQKGDKIGIYELIRTFKREGIENFITVRRKYINIMINLIEKQSKEIEEAKQKEKKAYIDGTNVAHELCNKYWEDKIKAKIEDRKISIDDIKDNLEINEVMLAEVKRLEDEIEFLQSLLEKE